MDDNITKEEWVRHFKAQLGGEDVMQKEEKIKKRKEGAENIRVEEVEEAM